MDTHRAFYHRLFSKRQGLGGVLGNLVPNGSTSSTAKQGATTSAASQSTENPFDPSGIVGAFSTLLGDITSGMPSSGPSSATTSSTSLTHSSSSPTGSTTAPASSTHTTTSTSSTTSTSTSTTPTTPTPTPTSTPSVSNVVHTSSDGTSVVYLTSTLPAASATAASHTSFLQNPSLEGGVFAAVAIAVLIIGFVVVTWTLRTRRRNRLERDLATAITFDPGAAEHYEHQEDTIEKPRLSGSSSSHGHGYGFGYGVQLAYAPQQEYHGPIGYGQYPVPAYYTASPNPAPYQVPSPTVPQPAEQGGANLTRKFSDRKPVPPLLPNPTYDPSNSHVSIPPQFYQQ